MQLPLSLMICPQSLPDKIKVFNELTVLEEEGLPCLEVLVKVSVGWIISEINQFDKTSCCGGACTKIMLILLPQFKLNSFSNIILCPHLKLI